MSFNFQVWLIDWLIDWLIRLCWLINFKLELYICLFHNCIFTVDKILLVYFGLRLRLLFCMIAQILALLTPRMAARVFHSRTVDIILALLVITSHLISWTMVWRLTWRVDLIWHLNWFVFPHGVLPSDTKDQQKPAEDFKNNYIRALMPKRLRHR